MPAVDDPQAILKRRPRWLAFATIGWNTIEGVVAVPAGAVPGSSALIRFGLDSTVEVGAVGDRARVPRWCRRGTRAPGAPIHRCVPLRARCLHHCRRRPRPSHRSEGRQIGRRRWPRRPGLLVMPLLARAEHKTGERPGSRALIAGSAKNATSVSLAAILLVGLLLRATVGCAWADPPSRARHRRPRGPRRPRGVARRGLPDGRPTARSVANGDCIVLVLNIGIVADEVLRRRRRRALATAGPCAVEHDHVRCRRPQPRHDGPGHARSPSQHPFRSAPPSARSNAHDSDSVTGITTHWRSPNTAGTGRARKPRGVNGQRNTSAGMVTDTADDASVAHAGPCVATS